MSETLLVNMRSQETRIVALTNGVVQDIHIERGARRGIVGNLYLGKVVRVLEAMQAAFVDFGAERTGLIHVSDLAAEASHRPLRTVRNEAAIQHRLHDGQKLVVQVSRDPLGSKGARLTTSLSLPSRCLVFLPGAKQLSVSQRIADSGERTRLLLLLQECLAAEGVAGDGGYILRTAAEGAGRDELRADIRFLKRLWSAVQRRSQAATGPQLLYEEMPLHLRAARDLAVPQLKRILVDHPSAYQSLQAFCEDYVPELADKLEHYTGVQPLLDKYGAEQEVQAALEPRVELDCGGYLVIEQTEAMVTIDVNTGSYVGRAQQDEVIFRTNMEAATILARQLRLRNLGGIIVVDFIDMPDPEHRRQLQIALQDALQRDPVRTTFNGMSELGLVVMTRKRSGESLQHTLCVACPVCQGSGVLKSARTVCYDIFRQISRVVAGSDSGELLVVAAQSVVNLLQGDEAVNLAELEAKSGIAISVRPEPSYAQDHFDIAML